MPNTPWLMEIYDLDAGGLQQVEDAVRALEGVTAASALRGDQPYAVVECPTQSDAIRVQIAVAAIDPAAIVVTTTEGADDAKLASEASA